MVPSKGKEIFVIDVRFQYNKLSGIVKMLFMDSI